MNLSKNIHLDTLEPGDQCVLDCNRKEVYTVAQKRPDIERVMTSGVCHGTYLILLRNKNGKEFFANNSQQVLKVLPSMNLKDAPVGKPIRFVNWDVGGDCTKTFTKIEWLLTSGIHDLHLFQVKIDDSKLVPVLCEGKLSFVYDNTEVSLCE